jgi:hypothetical protein
VRKLERMAAILNDDFKHQVAEAMREKFDGLEVVTEFDLFGSMAYVTTRADGEDFTPEQLAYLAGMSDGYGKALSLVRMVDAGVAG